MSQVDETGTELVRQPDGDLTLPLPEGIQHHRLCQSHKGYPGLTIPDAHGYRDLVACLHPDCRGKHLRRRRCAGLLPELVLVG